MKRSRIRASVFLATAVAAAAASQPAAAINPVKPVCSAAGAVSGLVGGACSAVASAGGLTAGPAGGAVKTVLAEGGNLASTATTGLALAAVSSWVLGGAQFALRETSDVLSKTTAPRLTSTWFSATYWRVAGIAAMLTLPFLFAAAMQGLLSSDVTVLVRAALGYLPLAMLAVSIAAPLTMLLLAASDQLAAIVSSAAEHQSSHFLNAASGSIGAVTGVTSSPFMAFFVGLLTVAVALALWLELLVRDAAVYVVVLMLPLTFAAFVWPARRVWAIRTVELLLALIVSKFVIVAVLSLGGVALGQSVSHSVTGMLAGGVLLILGALAPWALLRLLPMTEVASAAAGSLRTTARTAYPALQSADARASNSHDWASRMAQMRRSANEAERERPIEEPRKLDPAPGLAQARTNGSPRDGAAHAAGDGMTASPRDAEISSRRYANDAPPTSDAAEPPRGSGATPATEGLPATQALEAKEALQATEALQAIGPPRTWRLNTAGGRLEDVSPIDLSRAGREAHEPEGAEVHDPLPPAQPQDEGAL